MLPRLIMGSSALPGRGGRFVVTSKADWDAVFARDAQALAGKTIEISGTISEELLIQNRDMSSLTPLKIRSANPQSSLARLRMTGAVGGIDFAA